MNRIRVIAVVGGFTAFILALAGVFLLYVWSTPAAQPVTLALATQPAGDPTARSDRAPPPVGLRMPVPRGRRGGAGHPGVAATAAPLQHPREAAAAALDLVSTLRADEPDYFNDKHRILVKQLGDLEMAANAVMADDGKDQGRSDSLSHDLSAKLGVVIDRADIIGNRARETLLAKDQSLQLEAKLVEIAAK